MEKFNLIVTTTFGIEAVTKKELEKLSYKNLMVENGKLRLSGNVCDIAVLNTWLRTADRVLIEMGEFGATSFEALFDQVASINWAGLIPADGKMHVVGKSIKSALYSVSDCQAIVKRAIVKSMSKSYGIDHFSEAGPVYKIEVALLKDVVTLSVDTSGDGLHKRGYRTNAGDAPLKETLAAALVMMSRWKYNQPLIDPFCGSGTILIEAAMFARNLAPGLKRSFVCETWPGFEAAIFAQVRQEAKNKEFTEKNYQLIGYDVDAKVLQLAKENATLAGVNELIAFTQRDFADFASNIETACIVTNPPYGKRLADDANVRKLNALIGDLRDQHPHWNINVFTAFGGFERDFGEEASKNRKLYNGRILTRFYQYYAM